MGFSAGELSTVEQVLRGMPVRIAAGNSHLIIAAASISAAVTHLSVSATQGTPVLWNLVATTIPAVLIGGELAAIVAGRIPQHTLRLVLAGFLVFIGALSAYRLPPGWAPSAGLGAMGDVPVISSSDAALDPPFPKNRAAQRSLPDMRRNMHILRSRNHAGGAEEKFALN